MNKVFLSVALVLTLAGCSSDSDYDIDASRKVAEQRCEQFGAVFLEARVDYFDDTMIVTCVNKNTGTTFEASGVRAVMR